MQLQLPVDNYTTGDYHAFGVTIRRHLVLWATHLGDDVAAEAGTVVRAIGQGEVVLAQTVPGSEAHRSWGGLVVLRHDSNVKAQNPNDKSSPNTKYPIPNTFYSIYGHLEDIHVPVGERVQLGQPLGMVADGPTPENGWWRNPHLHFAIYTGPWEGNVPPGYWRPDQFWRTKRKWWHDPQKFIASHAD